MDNSQQRGSGQCGRLSSQEFQHYQRHQEMGFSGILGTGPSPPDQTFAETSFPDPSDPQWIGAEQGMMQGSPQLMLPNDSELEQNHGSLIYPEIHSSGAFQCGSNQMAPPQPIAPMTPASLTREDTSTVHREPFDSLVPLLQTILEFYLSLRETPGSINAPDLGWLKVQFQKGLSILEPVETSEVEVDDKKKYRCVLCQSAREYGTTGTLKRHITTEHYPSTRYSCPVCHAHGEQWITNRRDKHHEHMKSRHQHRALTKTEMANCTIQSTDPPQQCAYGKCGKRIRTWDEFFDCLVKHCSISGVKNQHKDRKGGGGGGHDPGHGTGGGQFPSPGGNGPGSNSGAFQPHGAESNYGVGILGAGYWSGNGNYGHQHPVAPDDRRESSIIRSESNSPATALRQPDELRHHEDIEARKDSYVDTMGENISADTKEPRPNLTKTLSAGGLGNTVPKIGLDKVERRFPLPEPEEIPVCEVCGHEFAGCRLCERLAKSMIQCHCCADVHAQRTPTGVVGDVYHKESLSDELEKRARGDLSSKRLLSMAQELAKSGQIGLNSDYRFTEVMRRLLSLRFECDIRKHRGLSKLSAEDESAHGEVALTETEKAIPREFQRLRYFERYLHATQSEGPFLTCIRETFIVSEPPNFIMSSLQEIVYQKVSLASQDTPDIPGHHLFYLTEEKDHKSSEANLEVVRRESTKKRAHLRVRIRAIANVLALRAAVTKSPPSVDKNETSDGWELGIPLPRVATEEDVVKGLTWLVQLLVVFLRMPPESNIYVLLASSWRNVPRLL
ncbi:hypothetical protein BJY04DRAFT_215189 [Aspergillus karnatakaensis]|uniref:putative C2H2 zinc finger domain protein n=1 Tax=Aspergillus karnatakaensis TaxID=1810916 RepID=UPI003CCD8E03